MRSLGTPRSTVRRSIGAVTLLAAALLPARAASLQTVPGGERAVDALAVELFAAGPLPSLSIAILRDGEVAYARAWGHADLAAGTPATPETRYRCASVSKLLTATALGRVVEDGRLDLDAPVTRYVPEWPAEPVVTARQLAGHLSGVAHYQDADRIDRQRHYGSVTEALEGFRDSPRAAAPGEEYEYSTHGYTLLSAAIEGAAGRPFLEVLETEVFGPLGMTSSGPDLRASPHEDMSTLYGRHGADPVLIDGPEDPSYKWAGGGLVSTPSDLLRLARGYLDGFLSDPVLEELWTSQATADGEETGVGLAWRIGEDPYGRRVMHHSGSMGGARTTLALYPDDGEAIAIMTNVTWPSDIHTTAMWLMEAYRRGDAPAAADPVDTGGAVAYDGAFGDDPASGTLSVADGGGWISPPEPFIEWSAGLFVDRMTLRPLEGSRYLLIAPWGIYGVDIEVADGRVRGVGEFGSTRWTFEATIAGR